MALGSIAFLSASVDPDSINAGAAGDTEVTVKGARVGDYVIPIAPYQLEDGLLPQSAWVSDDNAITLRLVNHTGGAVNGAARTWQFMVISGAIGVKVGG